MVWGGEGLRLAVGLGVGEGVRESGVRESVRVRAVDGVGVAVIVEGVGVCERVSGEGDAEAVDRDAVAVWERLGLWLALRGLGVRACVADGVLVCVRDRDDEGVTVRVGGRLRDVVRLEGVGLREGLQEHVGLGLRGGVAEGGVAVHVWGRV